VAAESARVQKQVDVWQLAEQSRDDVAAWLSSLLVQLREAVSSPPNSTRLRELIVRYQVCDRTASDVLSVDDMANIISVVCV